MKVCHPNCADTCVKIRDNDAVIECRIGANDVIKDKYIALYAKRAARGLDTPQPGAKHRGITLIRTGLTPTKPLHVHTIRK